MIKFGFVIAVVASIGCGGTQKPRASRSCEDAGVSARRVFEGVMAKAATDGKSPLPAGTTDRVEQLIVNHCVADAWSPAAIACVTDATTNDALELCAKSKLTEAQNRAVDDAIEAEVFGKTEASTLESDSLEGGSGGPRGGGNVTDDPCGGGGDGVSHDPCGGGE